MGKLSPEEQNSLVSLKRGGSTRTPWFPTSQTSTGCATTPAVPPEGMERETSAKSQLRAVKGDIPSPQVRTSPGLASLTDPSGYVCHDTDEV